MSVIELSNGLIDFNDLNNDEPQSDDELSELEIIKPKRLSFKDLDIKVPDPVARMSEDEIRRHTECTVTLSRYFASPAYEAYLKKAGFHVTQKQMMAMGVDEIEDMVKRVRHAASNKTTSGSMLKAVVHIGVAKIEGYTQTNERVNKHIDLTGWYESLRADSSFDDCLAQLEIEYGMVTMMSPERRLLWILVSSAGHVATMNKMTKVKQPQRPADVPAVIPNQPAQQQVHPIEEVQFQKVV
jgi:hypothetical protein